MNLQENIFRIKQIMGLLNEQTETSSGCKYSNWQNGDGKTRPKITIAKSDQTGVKVVYEGPESGFCIARAVINDKDTIHQLANIANEITSSKLKELYNSGIYVKPNLSEIKMTKKDNYHDIDIPFIPTTEDKAITNFARRGSWGNPYDAKAQFDIKLNEIYGDEKFGLIEKTDNPIIATGGKSSDIIEYFLAFRDLETYPIKSKQNPQPATTQTATETQIQTNTSSLTVQEKLKKGQQLTPEELNVKGDLNLDNSNITSLPEGLKVGGSLSLNNCYNLESLPKDLRVDGNLNLLGTIKLISLPEGLEVWGFIQIKDSALARIYTNDDLIEMVGSNGNLSYINRNSLRPLSDIIATDSPSDTTGTQPATTGGATSTNPQPPATTGGSTQTTSAINDELNNLITSGITDTGVVAPFKEKPYIGTGDTTYNQRKQSNYNINPNLRRPWGDPYIYYSATTGDIYYYLCGKRRDQPKKPVIPCPKLTSNNWIKSDPPSRTNAIKTNIFK